MQNLKAPFVVGFQITGRCTLNCCYCYAHHAARKDLSFVDALNVSQQLIGLGVFSISIEGGEPLLHPKWYEITKLFVDAGMEVALLTNGTLCNDRILEKLKKLTNSSEFFTLQISLDSHLPNVNDILRGRGATVLKNIETMASADLNIVVASVVHKYNMDKLLDLIEVLSPGVRRFHFMNLMPTSKLRNDDNSLFPNKDELAFFWRRMIEFRKNRPDMSISTPFNDINLSLGQGSLECEGCTAGLTRATITPDLKVLPCGLCDNCWVIGNLEGNSFEAIWQSPAAEYVRRLKTPPCKIVKKNSHENLNKVF